MYSTLNAKAGANCSELLFQHLLTTPLVLNTLLTLVYLKVSIVLRRVTLGITHVVVSISCGLTSCTVMELCTVCAIVCY